MVVTNTCVPTGFLIDFISLPVTIGFTAAAAFTIASAQVKNFLGLQIEADGAIQNWILAFSNSDKIRWADTALGCCTVLILFLTRVSCYTVSLV